MVLLIAELLHVAMNRRAALGIGTGRRDDLPPASAKHVSLLHGSGVVVKLISDSE
jgi:hypothetical protein